ncbi:AAA family ATPase [Chryseobacterium sp. Mn2064]|uniref:AAA family ATPase n=1 Tax=Chryseobacterium sp. Mn2064 TaxID=3395263 RepID=UPI003BD8F12B
MTENLQHTDENDFPVEKIFTNLLWDDLILNSATKENIIQIKNDILSHLINRATLYGPLGTGKTTTSALLGKILKQNVYRINAPKLPLYNLVEMKNYLNDFFIKAKENVWIVVLHEPYLLFRNRDAEISDFLIEKIKNYPGVILFTINGENEEGNAFYNKDYKTIVFNKPDVQERILLWKEYLEFDTTLQDPDFLTEISENFVVTGGQIVNAIRAAAITASKRDNSSLIQKKDLVDAITAEIKK